MKELANNILAQIEVDISEIDLYGYNIMALIYDLTPNKS